MGVSATNVRGVAIILLNGIEFHGIPEKISTLREACSPLDAILCFWGFPKKFGNSQIFGKIPNFFGNSQIFGENHDIAKYSKTVMIVSTNFRHVM